MGSKLLHPVLGSLSFVTWYRIGCRQQNDTYRCGLNYFFGPWNFIELQSQFLWLILGISAPLLQQQRDAAAACSSSSHVCLPPTWAFFTLPGHGTQITFTKSCLGFLHRLKCVKESDLLQRASIQTSMIFGYKHVLPQFCH